MVEKSMKYYLCECGFLTDSRVGLAMHKSKMHYKNHSRTTVTLKNGLLIAKVL